MGAAIQNVLQPGTFVWFEKTQRPLVKVLPMPGRRSVKQLAVRMHFLRCGGLLDDWSVEGVLSSVFIRVLLKSGPKLSVRLGCVTLNLLYSTPVGSPAGLGDASVMQSTSTQFQRVNERRRVQAKIIGKKVILRNPHNQKSQATHTEGFSGRWTSLGTGTRSVPPSHT
ncbi:uncharacterized protein TNCV_2949121 [Trichonephila clavipes]|nr:uncharacterized protein TNCV_2949121 [Trichonephila clavipes]